MPGGGSEEQLPDTQALFWRNEVPQGPNRLLWRLQPRQGVSRGRLNIARFYLRLREFKGRPDGGPKGTARQRVLDRDLQRVVFKCAAQIKLD
jgi:hypothetical protein